MRGVGNKPSTSKTLPCSAKKKEKQEEGEERGYSRAMVGLIFVFPLFLPSSKFVGRKFIELDKSEANTKDDATKQKAISVATSH